MARFSLLELLPDLPTIEVLDLGALEMAGQAPLYLDLAAAGQVRVTGFEPDLAGCVELNRRFRHPHRFFPKFVGNGKPAKFYETNAPYTGSLFEPNLPLLESFNDLAEVCQVVKVHDVSTARLDDLEDIDDVDYMKLDIQGAELDAFLGGERALQNAVLIHTEVCFVPIYRDAPLFADIDHHLRSRGFWFHTFLGLTSRTWRPMRVGEPGNPTGGVDRGIQQRLWSDAIYMKDPMRLEALPTVKLQKLAVLLHHLYNSYDFAYACLATADARLGTDVAQRYGARLTGATEPDAPSLGGP
jgi:FkbM family methyltransferase